MKLYFCSQFTINNKVEEKEFKKIIDEDVQHHDKDNHVKLLINYKNRNVKIRLLKIRLVIIKLRTYILRQQRNL